MTKVGFGRSTWTLLMEIFWKLGPVVMTLSMLLKDEEFIKTKVTVMFQIVEIGRYNVFVNREKIHEKKGAEGAGGLKCNMSWSTKHTFLMSLLTSLPRRSQAENRIDSYTVIRGE